MQLAFSWEPLAAALAILTLAPPGAAAKIRGFRGIAWGDSSVRLGRATQVSKVSDVICYERETESLVFGDSMIDRYDSASATTGCSWSP